MKYVMSVDTFLSIDYVLYIYFLLIMLNEKNFNIDIRGNIIVSNIQSVPKLISYYQISLKTFGADFFEHSKIKIALETNIEIHISSY